MRVERLCQAYCLDVRFVHFPLHPDTPDEGLTLEQLFAGRDIDVEQMRERMASLMRAEGLEYGDRRMTYNSLRAQELASWAVTCDQGEGIHQALFVAYFARGINLAAVDDLVNIAAGIGLDRDQATEVLHSQRYRTAVSADWERSRQLGVTGVPTYFAGGRAVVGAQPYDVLEQLVQLAGAQKR